MTSLSANRRPRANPESLDAAESFLSVLEKADDADDAKDVRTLSPRSRKNELPAGRAQDTTRRRLAGAVKAPGGDPPAAGEPEKVHGSSTPEPRADRGPSVFCPGDVLANRFRVVRYLAKGGMGELYEAEDIELHERVALKTILSTSSQDERFVTLFKREVHLARQVTHSNVCRIFDVYRHRSPAPAGTGEHAEDLLFLSMELLHGETLGNRLRREGRLSTADALVLARQMVAALTAAHRAGVVHRDFKTENVMVIASPGEDARLVVTDFGLAKRSSEDERSNLSLSLDEAAGEISGTPAYMAPEQVEGAPATPATDQYALGVVLYEMVTGRRPFVAETPLKTAVKRLVEEPPPPTIHVPDLDPRWEAAILRCLAREPRNRFASVAEVITALEGRPLETTGSDPWKKPIALVLLAAVVVAAMAIAFAWRPPLFGRDAEGINSLAVLPFVNTAKDSEQEYISDGMSESLIRRLSQLQGLKVIANTSSMRYKGKDADLLEVAHALGVRGVVTGKLLQRGEDLSISVELIDTRDQTLVWGEQYTRKAADVLAVQTEISREIANQLRIRLTSGEQTKLSTKETSNPRAYELLLKGRFHRSLGGTNDRRRAGEYFSQAIALDPACAPAYADLSDIYRSLVGSNVYDARVYLPRAEAAARKAIELDPSNAEAYYTLANLETYAWQWTQAERDYKRAIELNPNLGLAHRWYAQFLAHVGRHEAALAEIQRARELDPLSPGVGATVGYVHYVARQHDKAIAELVKVEGMDRGYPYVRLFLGHAYAAKGMYAQAVAAYEEAVRLGLDSPTTQGRLAAACARAGERDRALAILTQLQSRKGTVSLVELAIVYTSLGNTEQAFVSLEQAYASRDPQLQLIGASPVFDPLRADPRFTDLVRRVGLAP